MGHSSCSCQPCSSQVITASAPESQRALQLCPNACGSSQSKGPAPPREPKKLETEPPREAQRHTFLSLGKHTAILSVKFYPCLFLTSFKVISGQVRPMTTGKLDGLHKTSLIDFAIVSCLRVPTKMSAAWAKTSME